MLQEYVREVVGRGNVSGVQHERSTSSTVRENKLSPNQFRVICKQLETAKFNVHSPEVGAETM